MPDTPALYAAKDAVQAAENLIHRKIAEGSGPGSLLTLRDGMILVDALVRVMEAIEAANA